MAITMTVNGKAQALDVEPDMPLLWALRETLGLTGTKFGCGISACGACTVHLDGRAVRSCTLPISAADGKHVTTIEGLAADGTLHKVQQAWIAHQVPQCGYCQSGHDHGGRRTPRADPEPDRRRDRRRHHEHLPLRHVRARARGHPSTRPTAKERRHEEMDAGARSSARARVAGGGFLLGVAGFTFAPSRHTLVSADAAEKGQLTTWITVTPDNIVTILIPHCEMGQGTPTALAMMAAEEMEADWTAGPRAGSAGARRVRERLHRPRGRAATTCRPCSGAAWTTAPTRSRSGSASR